MHSTVEFQEGSLIRKLFVAIVCTVLLAGTATAAPVIDLSWNACSPITHDRVLPPGATSSDLYVIATGVTGPTQGYQFRLFMGQELNVPCNPYKVADAWRFDDAGCEGQAGLMQPFYTSSKACPALLGSATPTVIYRLQYGVDFSQDLRLLWAAGYTPQPADPNVTYQLLRLRIDHTYAVTGPGDPPNTCGGFEKPMCITLWGGIDLRSNCLGPNTVNASYIDGNGNEHYFANGPVDVTSFRIDSSIQACNLATPVTPTTWGAIRGQYR